MVKRRTQNRQQLFAVITAGLLLFITWKALLPDDTGFSWLTLPQADKLLHALAFGTLGFCAALAGHTGTRRLALVAAGLLAYGGFIEVAQSFVPGRDCSALDLLADAVGIAGGLVLARRLLPPLPT